MKPGKYLDQTIEDYHESSGVSKTGLCLVDEAPAVYEHLYLKGQRISRDSASKRLGKMFHAMMDGSFENEYAIGPATRRNTNAWKDFVKGNEGKICVQEAEVSESRKMVESINNFGPTKDLIKKDGNYEVSYYWNDQETGLLCKCRPDYISADQKIIVDFKTTCNIGPESFRWDAYKYHYYVSAALTMQGIKAVTGITPDRYIFLAVHTTPPFLVAAYEATPDEIELGQAFVGRNLFTLRQCQEGGQWPGLEARVLPLGLPFKGSKELKELRTIDEHFSYLVG